MSITTSSDRLVQPLKVIPLQDRLLAYIEQVFWESREIPTIAQTARDLRCAESTLKKMWANEDFQEALSNRGVTFRTAEDVLLTPEQLIVANVFLNTLDKTSIRTTLQTLGVSQIKYNAWQNDPAYVNYVQKRAELMYENLDAELYKSLVQGIQRGDSTLIKLGLEMKGKYVKTEKHTFDVRHVLVDVVDIISRHVKNPETLEAIANELEGLNVSENERNQLPQELPVQLIRAIETAGTEPDD